jgi:hypothetical protein
MTGCRFFPHEKYVTLRHGSIFSAMFFILHQPQLILAIYRDKLEK